jgi:putative Mn2+ efflux pump MntP
MRLLDIILIGIGLSADAFSVTISNMFAASDPSRGQKLAMPLTFGLFQGLMPVLGFSVAGFAVSFIERFAGVITFIILGAIGGKMVWDGLYGDEDGGEVQRFRITLGKLLFQGVATSIDAFAVGVSLAAQGIGIWSAAFTIACSTFICCLIALFLGRKLGELIGQRAQVVGGLILVFIGVKALF